MKYFVVFAVCMVAVQALTEEMKEKLKKHKTECLEEIKPDKQLVEKLMAGDYKTENEPLKRYVHCILMKLELMTKDGKFRKDVALAMVPNLADKAEVEKQIDSCLDNKGLTPQQAAWNYITCYHGKEHPIFV